jgi:hypothetical protein
MPQTRLRGQQALSEGKPMARLKIFSNRETVIWCICLALAGFGIVAAYVSATSKSAIDADMRSMHELERSGPVQ